jgi:hypothetical protein
MLMACIVQAMNSMSLKFPCVLAVLVLTGLHGAVPAQPLGEPFGNEFRVNRFEEGDQRIPIVASNAAGQSVVIWQSLSQEEPGWTIYAQRLSPQLAFLGEAVQVNNYNDGSQDGQSLVIGPDGSFAVAWNGSDRSSPEDVVSVRRFDSGGVPLSGDKRISATTGDIQLLPRLGRTASDDLIISWEASNPVTGFDILTRRADGLGAAQGPISTLNSSTDGAQRRADLAVAEDGSVVAVWQDALADGNDWGVFVRCLDPQGQGPIEAQVNQLTEGQQFRPRVARAADGRFAVVWQDNIGLSSFTYRRIMTRLFDSDCRPLGPELQVNQLDDGIQDQPAIAVDGAGNYVLAWQSFPPDFELQGVYARRLGRDGVFLGEEFRVSEEIEAFQDFPAVSVLPDGGYLFVWESAGQDASGYGIYARQFAGPEAAELRVVAGAEQAAVVGEVFEQALVIEVRDQWGQLRVDEPIRASSPSDAAGLLFANGLSEFEGQTDASGRVSFALRANSIPGAHQLQVEAAASGAVLSVGFVNLGPVFEPSAIPVPVIDRWALVLLAGLILVLVRIRL